MEQWELEARLAIADLVARYNANGDSGRFDQVLDLFAPDATMETPGAVYHGVDEIRRIFTGAQGTLSEHGAGAPTYIRHMTSTHQIDLLGPDEAKGRCYYQVLMPHGVDHWGRYIDTYGVVDGRWLITSRKVTTDGAVPGGWGEAATGQI